MLHAMFEAIIVFILKALTAIACCLFIVAPLVLVVRFAVAFIHDHFSRR
jgi:hypothetical protein